MVVFAARVQGGLGVVSKAPYDLKGASPKSGSKATCHLYQNLQLGGSGGLSK